ncbi:LacI family DNA-binding transcriptional regulator [Anaerosporobacter faecicola]|uniref:LacI family DNA-binding transcriptional regulator n=1 Tax=Anaerosporobacter faecicola TaxID=2718714 RepID=UPI00143A14F0|nr:LacI family DNA-binding transcriptional regulator [Anaerosporobacter faecicola]
MNIYDISQKAGVSIATVSRVINGNSNVSEKTRKKVMAVIEQYDYTPNAFARGLGLNTMQTIGILCADSSDPYLASAIYYIEQMLHKEQYDSLLCCTGYNQEDKEKYLNLLLSKKVDSIILVGSNFVEADEEKNQYIKEAAKSVPIMLLNGAIDAPNIYSSLCDDYHATFQITQKLLKTGHERILYLYNSHSYSGKKKLKGFHDAYSEMGLKINESYIQYFVGDIHETRDFLVNLTKKGLTFDSIITSDDNLAVGALKFAKLKGISVPKDLSIIGYNNSMIATCCDPELTSIDNKLETICKNCVSTLMNIFNGNSVPFRSVFSAELVKRETTDF